MAPATETRGRASAWASRSTDLNYAVDVCLLRRIQLQALGHLRRKLPDFGCHLIRLARRPKVLVLPMRGVDQAGTLLRRTTMDLPGRARGRHVRACSCQRVQLGGRESTDALRRRLVGWHVGASAGERVDRAVMLACASGCRV